MVLFRQHTVCSSSYALLLATTIILVATNSSPTVATNSFAICAVAELGPVRLAVNDTGFVTCFNGTAVRTDTCPEDDGDFVFNEDAQTCEPVDDGYDLVPEAVRPNVNFSTALPATVLYVWAGPDNPGPNCRDAVVVVNADLNTTGFGSIINVSYTPHWGGEPHHVGLSNNSFLAVGTFNSYLYGNPDIYVFNVSNPLAPQLIAQVDPPLSAVTDSFLPQADGGFWVSQMGSANGSTPGRIVRLSSNFSAVREEPANPPPGFAPHGFVLHNATQRIVTTDYVDYSSSILSAQGVDKQFVGAYGAGKPKYGHVLRVWQLPSFALVREYDLNASLSKGLMTVQLLGTSGVAAVTNGQGIVFAVNVSNLDTLAKPVHYLSASSGSCVFVPLAFSSGRRVVLTSLGLDLVQLVDTSDPWNWKTLQEIYLPRGSHPHAVTATRNGTLLAVSTYYVHQLYNGTRLGTFAYPGTGQVYFFEVFDGGNSIRFLPRLPGIDFANDVNDFRGEYSNAQCGSWRPHGMIFRAPSPAPAPVTTPVPTPAPTVAPALGPFDAVASTRGLP